MAGKEQRKIPEADPVCHSHEIISLLFSETNQVSTGLRLIGTDLVSHAEITEICSEQNRGWQRRSLEYI